MNEQLRAKAAVDAWMGLKGVSRRELADKLEIDASTLWRNLKSANPTKTFLLAISAVTGLTMEELTGKPEAPLVCEHCQSPIKEPEALAAG